MYQGSYSLEKVLNFDGCLEKALNCMAGPEKPLHLHCLALNYYFEGPKFSLESIRSLNNQNLNDLQGS